MRRKIELSFTGWSIAIFGSLLIVGLIGYGWMPATTAPVRVFIVITIISGFLMIISLVVKFARRSRRAMIGILAVIAVLLVWARHGAKEVDTASLRGAYLRQLQSFSGVPYCWGGETGRGIDCSGLARVAMWQAMMHEGLRTRNTRLLGPMLWRFWWHDLGASSIAECDAGYTRRICSTPELAGFVSPKMEPGDIATNGVHVLVYAGDGSWIEASPDDMKVVTSRATADSRRPYFRTQMRILRWWVFTERP